MFSTARKNFKRLVIINQNSQFPSKISWNIFKVELRVLGNLFFFF